MTDPNVERVRTRLAQRAGRGLQKYGVDTTRGDLAHGEWLQHLQDELLDAAVYVERLKMDDGELRTLVDSAYELVYMVKPASPAESGWRTTWLKQARKHGAGFDV